MSSATIFKPPSISSIIADFFEGYSFAYYSLKNPASRSAPQFQTAPPLFAAMLSAWTILNANRLPQHLVRFIDPFRLDDA